MLHKLHKNCFTLENHINSHLKPLLLSTMLTLVLDPRVSLSKSSDSYHSLAHLSCLHSHWCGHRPIERGYSFDHHIEIHFLSTPGGLKRKATQPSVGTRITQRRRTSEYPHCTRHSHVPSPSHLLGQANYLPSKTKPSNSILRL